MVLIVAALFGLKWIILDSGYVLTREVRHSEVVQRIDLPDAPKNAQTAVQPIGMPNEKPAELNGLEVRG